MCSNGNGEPCYPPCADDFDYVDKDLVKKYCENDIDTIDAFIYCVKGIKEKGDNNMKEYKNEVLNLYYERHRNKIIENYEEIEREYNENIDTVKAFYKITEEFNEKMEDLYKSLDNFDNDYIVQSCDSNMFKYKINNDKIRDNFVKEILPKRQEELYELKELTDEINAQLSLSNDLEYQQEILINYGVLDKKTKKLVD